MNRFYCLGLAIAMMAVAACSTHNNATGGGGGNTPEGEACMSSAECSTLYCQWPEGHTCGDGTDGTCAPLAKGIDCSSVVDYVCGCDGKTYANACYALTSGESVAHKGMCP